MSTWTTKGCFTTCWSALCSEATGGHRVLQPVDRDGSVSGEASRGDADFAPAYNDLSKLPHEFQAYHYDSDSRSSLEALAKGCVRAWGLDSPAEASVLDQTGFNPTGIVPLLNAFGIARLPSTPPRGPEAMRATVVTDVTEVLAVLLLKEKHPEVTLPRPRVFHKQLPHMQHHGIDLVGYTMGGGLPPSLLVVEVMATDSDSHPPDVVREKRRQLLGETLGDPTTVRLMRELAWLHAESRNGDRDVINRLIIELQLHSLGTATKVLAVPVLVSQSSRFKTSDWGPFLDSLQEFERAYIPSTIRFIAICPRCHPLELVDRVKVVASGGAASPHQGG